MNGHNTIAMANGDAADASSPAAFWQRLERLNAVDDSKTQLLFVSLPAPLRHPASTTAARTSLRAADHLGTPSACRRVLLDPRLVQSASLAAEGRNALPLAVTALKDFSR